MAGYDDGGLFEETNEFWHGGGSRCAWGILFLRFVYFAMVVGHTMHWGRTWWFCLEVDLVQSRLIHQHQGGVEVLLQNRISWELAKQKRHLR